MTAYSWAWTAWVVAFLLVEGFAIADKRPGDTLTEHVRKVFATQTKPAQWRWRRFALLAFMVGLTTHFLFGWP